MSVILGKAWEGYNLLFDEFPDERTKPWFLVAKPYQGIALVGIYLMFVLKWGPRYMKGRPVYNLDKLLIVYNFLQVVSCVYIFYYSIVLAWGWNYKWICEPVDTSTSELAMDIAKTTYLYFLMKVVDLLDTVFFVLRKKHNQVSFLHLYHHTGMVGLTWGAVTYLPGGHGTLIGVINSFVHVVMYSYYLYTVVNPSAKQSMWWKKYITQLQILQFFWCVVHMFAIVLRPDCGYPRWTSAVFLPQNVFILVLFVDFYIKTYIKKPQAQKNKPSKSDLQMKSFVNGINNRLIDGNHEFKTLSLALNALNSNTYNGVHSSDNGSNSPQNGTHSPQNGAMSTIHVSHQQNGDHNQQNGDHYQQNGSYRIQNGSRSSLKESDYSKNGSRTGNSYHVD